MKSVPKTLPKFYLQFLKEYKLYVTGLIFVALYWALQLSLSSYFIKELIDQVSQFSGPQEALFSEVAFPAIAIVLLMFLAGVVYRLYDFCSLRMIPPMKAEIISYLFNWLLDHSYSYFQNNFAGSLANKISQLAEGSDKIINKGIEVFLARFFGIVFAAILMYLVQPIFCYILVAWAAIYLFFTALFSRKTHHYSELLSESSSSVIGAIVDCMSNILNVKLFSQKAYEKKFLAKKLDDTVKKDQKLQWYLLKLQAFQAACITVMISLMMWFLVDMRSKNEVTVGDFALILTLAWGMIDAIWQVGTELARFSREIGICSQALSSIITQHEIVDVPHAKPLQISKGKIVFENVTFHYGDKRHVFKNKSVTINSGEKVGLVGFSGSGKSTFVNLILRFFDVESGAIFIDEQNIAKVTQESLRGQIAVIPQDPVLFHRTLFENIHYGNIKAQDEEVFTASKKAHCHEFVENLPEGYQTYVGERGVKLSGGQRQRIAIARAILKNAPIVILDEATSSLDSITENYIQESISKLMEGRTTIVIAHRLSTLFSMDRILVFHQGKIIEEGTHSELIKKNGHYAQLWACQAGGFILDS